jgi:hypothetical protein
MASAIKERSPNLILLFMMFSFAWMIKIDQTLFFRCKRLLSRNNDRGVIIFSDVRQP